MSSCPFFKRTLFCAALVSALSVCGGAALAADNSPRQREPGMHEEGGQRRTPRESSRDSSRATQQETHLGGQRQAQVRDQRHRNWDSYGYGGGYYDDDGDQYLAPDQDINPSQTEFNQGYYWQLNNPPEEP